MIKKLTRHGNSLALVIDRAVLDLLQITAETQLEISTDGSNLTVTPVRDRQVKVEQAVQGIHHRNGRMLRRLGGQA